VTVPKKIRVASWFIGGMVRKHHRKISVGFIAGIALVLLFLRFGATLTSRLTEQHTVMGLVGSFTPTQLPIEIQRLLSVGLTSVDATGDVSPALATSWTVSPDGKEYTFSLRTNVSWHDGKPFTAYDVNYNLRDVEFTALNDSTLQVKLKEPFTPLPSFLSKPLFRKGLIGLGSYKISAIRLKGEYVSYSKLTSLEPDLPELEIKFYPSETMVKTAFKLGEVTMLDEITDPDPFTAWNTVTLQENRKFDHYVGVFFNLNNEFIAAKKKELRQALAYAITKSEENRVATPLSTKSWAYTNRVKQYEKDEGAARELIEGIGIQPEDTITLSTFPAYFGLAQTIASEWEAVGMKTKIKVENSVPTDYQALLVAQEIPPDPDQYPMWHSTQKETNITGYANPKIDKLLEDGRKETDPENREVIYFDFQRYLVEDAPAIFLFHPVTYTVTRK